MNTLLSLSRLTTMVSSLLNQRLSQPSSLPLLIPVCLLLTLLPLATLAQTITSSTPQSNTNAAAVTSNVSLTASAPFLNTASTTSSIKVFSRQAGGKKAGTAMVSGNTLTFDPAADFKPGETVFTTLTTASGLAKAHVYQFTTAAAVAPGTFSGTTNIAVGDSPQSVAAADVEGDGDLDILTVSRLNPNVNVLLNNGSGAFSNATDVAVGGGSYDVAAADVDGDGDLDILTANLNNNTVSVRLNNGPGTFTGATEVAVGDRPISVAAADVDGDGDLDILTANLSSNTVSVRLNDGKGTFTGATEVAVGDRPGSVVAADVDGDGDLDILTANDGSNNVSVRLNNGSGAFSNATDVAVGDYPVSVAAADVDGDGDLDILTANANSNNVSVLLNNGSGAFSGTTIAAGSGVESVAAADVDGDGDLDILAANVGIDKVSVLLNNGSGTFSVTTDVSVGTYPINIVTADMDGDGDIDIVTANHYSDNVSVRLNGPIITLSAINKASEKEDVAVSFSSSDFTNAFSSTSGSLSKVKITALPDASAGVLKVSGVDVTTNQEIPLADLSKLTFVPAADYNGSVSFKWNGSNGSVYAASDAAVDITLAAVNDAPSFTKGADQKVNENTGVQTIISWATAISPGPANESSQTIDFIVTNDNTSLFAVQPAIADNGTLTYTLAANTYGSATVSVKIKDDGGTANGGVDESALQTFAITVKGTRTVTGLTPQSNALTAPLTTHVSLTASAPFLNTASTTGSIKVFSRQAGGKKLGTATVSGNTITFDPATDFKPGETVFTTLTTASGLAKAHVFSFTTAAARAPGTFSGTTDVPVIDDPYDNHPTSVAAADMDGDGDLDMVVAKYTTNNVNVRFNDGAGSFSAGSTMVVGGGPHSVAAADVDGDEDLDVLTANSWSDNVSVLLNDGNGSFSAATNVAVGDQPLSVAAADVDGDGDLDILTANGNSNNVSVRLNDSNGSFSGTINVAVGNGPVSVAVADVDGDGDLDILTANAYSNNMSVVLNDGNGSFSAATNVAVGDQPLSVAAADVDGDGDLDILTANGNSDNMSVQLNDGKGAFNAAADVPVGDRPASVVVADVDGDGDLDILCTNYYSNNVSVRRNDGSGVFSGTTNFPVGVSPTSIAAADVDGDGDVDILTANVGNATVSVRLNGLVITLSNINKSSEKEDVAVSFTSADFTAAFSSTSGSLSKVKITSLPEAATGVLKVNAVAVTLNQEIPLADLANLTFAPAANYNGSVSFQWNGTEGSVYAETDATVHITLAAVNDAPSFTKGADQRVNEDAGLQTVAGWATSIAAGPGDESSQTINFVVTNDNTSLFAVQPAIAADGTLTYTPAANAYGSATVSVKIKDNGGTANGGVDESTIQTFTITVTAVNDAPLVLATPATQQVQYSDQITPVAISATDVDNTPAELTVTVFWKLATAASFTIGLPAALELNKTSAGNWTLSGRMMLAPGSYLVRVSVNDGTADASNNSAYRDIEIVVTPEDARVTYTGALFASTSGATSSTATVTLSATIQDITATADANGDILFGDIRQAKVTFINRDNNTVLASNVPVGLVSSADTKTGTATVNVSLSTGSANAASFTIGIMVNGYYTRNSSDDNTLVTVSKPLNDFVTGGGFLILSNSAGQKAGNQGSKNNFGFNIKYSKKGTSLQGNINTIMRRTEADGIVHVYQIKGNVMTSLSVKASTSTTGQATFNGKASIQDITNPLAVVSVDGNATLQVTMTDMGEPGSSDKIGITVWNKDGGLWFASTWDGVKTVEKTLAGGNLIIRGASTARMDNSIEAEPSAAVVVYPNPVVDKLTIDLKGMPAIEAKTILTDAVGKAVLENAHKVVGESLLEIDMSSLRSGLYLISLRTKASYQVVKVIKQ